MAHLSEIVFPSFQSRREGFSKCEIVPRIWTRQLVNPRNRRIGLKFDHFDIGDLSLAFRSTCVNFRLLVIKNGMKC